jgi:membrane-associated phospholipid phosphatase
LAPFFYLTYGTANWLASVRADVPSVVFAWERSIPFLAWTIIPYWTINAFYGLSLFLCRTVGELDAHGRRLLSAQLVAVGFFVLAPLRFTFPKPDTGGGLSGFLFEALAGFDKPFNQAPSLHIALLVILWDLYRRILPHWSLPILHAWSALIGISVLTTYQHHFIDIPTGALLGVLCVWAFPLDARSPLADAAGTTDPRRLRLAAVYGTGAVVVAVVSVVLGGAGLWLLWPAVSLVMVALAYAVLGPGAFARRPDGRLGWPTVALFLPYLIAARINVHAWTHRSPAPVAIADGVRLGRLPGLADAPGPAGETIVNVAAEMDPPGGRAVVAVPMLDLVTPPAEVLAAAADAAERARRSGPVLVACALGYSRSAATVATWLLRTGRAPDAAAACAAVRAAKPLTVISPALESAVAAAGRLP